MRLSLRAGLAGVAAAAVALAAAEAVAVVTGPNTAPLPAVGSVVIDHVPAPVKDFGIAVFGVHDKTALLAGTAILLAAYAWGVGVLGLRSWRVALAGVALFGLIGVAAAATRHDASPFAVLPSLVAAVVAAVMLRHLLRVARGSEPATEPARGSEPAVGVGATTGNIPSVAYGPGHDAGGTAHHGTGANPYVRSGGGRRTFLKTLGVWGAVAAVSGIGGRLLSSRKAVGEARGDVALPVARQTALPVPPGAQAPGAVAYVTSNDDFYRIDTALYPPLVDPKTWQLRIHGMVRNPITISWDDLLKRPMVERHVTLACVSNEVGGDLIGNALWLGVPIKELLDEADPLPEADQVVQRSVDGWTCGSPTAVLRDGRDALLAVGMNGEPLPVDHGFPVRMVVPGLYGYVSACKWITEIELTRFADFDAYWVPRGWSAQAPIKTSSRIDTPRDGSRKAAGEIVVAGVAWAQHRGIAKVEVQVDGGVWAEATLADTVSGDTWRQWSYRWQASAGEHTLRVRATDRTGQTQTSTPADPAPDGAQGWHAVRVEVG